MDFPRSDDNVSKRISAMLERVRQAKDADLYYYNQPITELRTAVIWTKGVSTFRADYSVEDLPTNPWIHQPFEGYDNLSPEKLMDKWKL